MTMALFLHISLAELEVRSQVIRRPVMSSPVYVPASSLEVQIFGLASDGPQLDM